MIISTQAIDVIRDLLWSCNCSVLGLPCICDTPELHSPECVEVRDIVYAVLCWLFIQQAQEWRQNSRLIATAPELLSALRDLLRVDDEWHGSVNSEMATARHTARCVIARAEGKSS